MNVFKKCSECFLKNEHKVLWMNNDITYSTKCTFRGLKNNVPVKNWWFVSLPKTNSSWGLTWVNSSWANMSLLELAQRDLTHVGATECKLTPIEVILGSLNWEWAKLNGKKAIFEIIGLILFYPYHYNNKIKKLRVSYTPLPWKILELHYHTLLC